MEIQEVVEDFISNHKSVHNNYDRLINFPESTLEFFDENLGTFRIGGSKGCNVGNFAGNK